MNIKPIGLIQNVYHNDKMRSALKNLIIKCSSFIKNKRNIYVSTRVGKLNIHMILAHSC